MYEVLSRRFRRARAVTDPTDPWKLPDLIVVDGGKGQLAMALAAARDVGVAVGPGAEMSIVALAKERDDMAPLALDDPPPDEEIAASRRMRHPSLSRPSPPPRPVRRKDAKKGDTHRPDRVFLPNVKDPIPIRPTSGEMFILQQLRDEAHRFAVSFHRGQRRRLTLRSVLSTIPGIGPGRQRQLLRHFGSVKRVRQATIDELAAVSGMTRTAAEAVFDHFARQPEEAPAPEARATAEELAIEDAFTNSDGEVLEMTADAVPPNPPDPRAAGPDPASLSRPRGVRDLAKFDALWAGVV